MLYSEAKERENRFIIALKIIFPFLLLLVIFFYSFKFFPQNKTTLTLLTVLVPVYVYYIFYLIYNGFRNTLIDPTTKAFTAKKISNIIQKASDKQGQVLVLLHVKNIVDINERYGIANGDSVLNGLIETLDRFLVEHNFKNVPIGRCRGGNFLLLIRHPQKELKHLLTQFVKNFKQHGIRDIEVKLEYVMLDAQYDNDVKNSIERLFILLEEKKKHEGEPLNIKPNEFETIVNEAIKYNCIIFKYQPVLNTQTQTIEIFEVLPKIETKYYGILSKNQIERMVNYGGHEKVFDQKILTLLINDITSFPLENKLISIDISPVSLRNNSFKLYLTTLFREKKIDPHRFILEISEKNSYEDMARFREILLEYQKMGFKIALSNFGGNNCGFEYLKYLPIDLVKFDIEFTKKMNQEMYARVFENYVKLAHNLGIKTMIKFVDKEALFEKVKGYNLDYIQGFYIEKPKNLEQIIGDNE